MLFSQLNIRLNLLEKGRMYYSYLEKGIGELAFDNIIDHLIESWLILYGLLVKINNTTFQVYKVIISPDQTYIFQVKNYEGDYYIEGGRWYLSRKSEIINLHVQLQRYDTLFQRLLNNNERIEGAVLRSGMNGRCYFQHSQLQQQSCSIRVGLFLKSTKRKSSLKRHGRSSLCLVIAFYFYSRTLILISHAYHTRLRSTRLPFSTRCSL
ncbi:nuclease-related domain-containing protein [Anaerobacillus alkalidiazotrophicus]|uniref:nuclease-related domain-containing protein n=1 Tax=Anaerobacillus alkalidiazotrophicus TaxID=472963 RepID=UPI003898FE15